MHIVWKCTFFLAETYETNAHLMGFIWVKFHYRSVQLSITIDIDKHSSPELVLKYVLVKLQDKCYLNVFLSIDRS